MKDSPAFRLLSLTEGVWTTKSGTSDAGISPAGVSPGGKEENTGSASKLSDRLTMGTVEVTSIDPVKLLRSNSSDMPSAAWPPGGSVLLTLGSTSPAVSLAVKVTVAEVSEGLA